MPYTKCEKCGRREWYPEHESEPTEWHKCRGRVVDKGVTMHHPDLDDIRRDARMNGDLFKSQRRTVRIDREEVTVWAWTVREKP
jgi:hypothetical protein